MDKTFAQVHSLIDVLEVGGGGGGCRAFAMRYQLSSSFYGDEFVKAKAVGIVNVDGKMVEMKIVYNDEVGDGLGGVKEKKAEKSDVGEERREEGR